MLRILLLTVGLATLGAGGCADPAKGKAPAVVAAPVAAPATTAASAAPAAAPALDAVGTIGFTAAKVTKSHDGVFGSWKGGLRLAGERLDGIDIEVQVASVVTDQAKLDTHLKSPDFFDAVALPTATFHSTEIRAAAPADSPLAGANATVIGDLSIHGVTKRVEVPAIVAVSAETVTARTEFSINRQDFGVAYPGKPDDLIRDGVVLKVDLSATRTPGAAAPKGG